MLKSWSARRLEQVSKEGRTRPLTLRCSMVTESTDGDGAERAESFVVKALGLPEVTTQGLFSEAVGNLVARRLGLDVPEVALILLAEDLVRAIDPQLAIEGLSVEPGIGVGTKFIRGLANVTSGFAPSADELEQMALLYAFDLLVQNPDRRLDNPNCAVLNGKLVPFDFDMCFSFLLALALGGSEPWEVSKHGLGAKHLWHGSLRNRASVVSWGAVCKELSSITNEEIFDMVSAVPVEWQSNAERVRNHLISVRDRVDLLELELQRSLS